MAGTSLIKKRSKTRLGTAAVEMALVSPVFILIVLGIFEFGRGMMVEQLLANGARLGARRAILDNRTNSEVKQRVKDFCQSAIGSTVAVTISVNGVVNADLTTAERGDLCNVSVSVPFNQVSLLATPKWLTTATLRSECTMERE